MKFEMPVSRPFFDRSAKSLYRWIQDMILNNLLIGCKIARFNFDVNLPNFLFGGVAIESRPFFYRSEKYLYRCIQDIVLNNLLIGCKIARFNFEANLPHFLFGGVTIDFIGQLRPYNLS